MEENRNNTFDTARNDAFGNDPNASYCHPERSEGPRSAAGTPNLHPNARQCAFIKTNGQRCGAPAKGEHQLCHSHLDHQHRIMPQHIVLPPLEDAHSIQVATLDIMNALLYGRIERSHATALLYGLQLAQSNLKNLAPRSTTDEAHARSKSKKKEYDPHEELTPEEEEENESLVKLLLRELSSTPYPDADANDPLIKSITHTDRRASPGNNDRDPQ